MKINKTSITKSPCHFDFFLNEIDNIFSCAYSGRLHALVSSLGFFVPLSTRTVGLQPIASIPIGLNVHQANRIYKYSTQYTHYKYGRYFLAFSTNLISGLFKKVNSD